jgi:hypothetical protein
MCLGKGIWNCFVTKEILGDWFLKSDIKEPLKGLAEHLQEYVPESDDSYNFELSPFDIDFPVPLLPLKEQNFLRTFC